MYEYNAIVNRVVDGDTVDVTIDLGFSVWKKMRVRMEGINTPESRTRDLEEKKRGLAAKDRLKSILEFNNNKCILKVSGVGKYGRVLAELFVKGHEKSVNELLMENGHAYQYHGEKKKTFGS